MREPNQTGEPIDSHAMMLTHGERRPRESKEDNQLKRNSEDDSKVNIHPRLPQNTTWFVHTNNKVAIKSLLFTIVENSTYSA